MRSTLRTIPPPDSFNRHATTSVISLGQIRSGPRNTNEYVESPRAHAPGPLKSHSGLGGGGVSSPGFAHRVIQVPRGTGGEVGGGDGGSLRTGSTAPSSVVSQPLGKLSPLKKETSVSLDGNGCNNRVAGGDGEGTLPREPGAMGDTHREGINCDVCGKCRCSACTEPRSLPSYWCCGNTCEISPEKILNVGTCFCCVKGIFYHSGAEEDNECYENPCGCCSTPHCCRRWTVMSLMALCLPCLWMYWPARCCLASCTSCYNCCRHKGCSCRDRLDKNSVLSVGGGGGVGTGGGSGIGVSGSKSSQTQRLLIESDSSSA